ncbi:hypothetical protein QO179_23985 [Bacillus stercoris]|nr:hypothetical protein [Bacillus stercoris]
MIQKLLDISTCHILESTANWLDESNLLVVYPKSEYGWFVLCPTEWDSENVSQIPSDLLFILLYAQKRNCDWISIDRDGSQVSNLPTYIW